MKLLIWLFSLFKRKKKEVVTISLDEIVKQQNKAYMQKYSGKRRYTKAPKSEHKY